MFSLFKVKGSDLEAGDHIYSWRAAFTYAHHGIYVGEGTIVHFTTDHQLNGSSSGSGGVNSSQHKCKSSLPSSTTFPDCGFKKSVKSGVTISCLNCFKKYGSLYRYIYKASSSSYLTRRGGTCTTAKSDDPEAVIHRAVYLLYNNGFGEYNLHKRNCEDFALYCKTGLLVIPNQKGGVVGASGQIVAYLELDIGVRKDVVKVKVEDIAALDCAPAADFPKRQQLNSDQSYNDCFLMNYMANVLFNGTLWR